MEILINTNIRVFRIFGKFLLDLLTDYNRRISDRYPDQAQEKSCKLSLGPEFDDELYPLTFLALEVEGYVVGTRTTAEQARASSFSIGCLIKSSDLRYYAILAQGVESLSKLDSLEDPVGVLGDPLSDDEFIVRGMGSHDQIVSEARTVAAGNSSDRHQQRQKIHEFSSHHCSML